jgi:F0F1-type ATP synthase assembly protein I
VTEPSPHAKSVLTLADAMLRTALVPGLVTVAVGSAVAAVMVGSAGLFGALAGGAVAFGSSLMTLFLMRWSADLPVTVVMAVAMGGFALKMVVLLGVMVALQGVDAFHPMSLALTFLATVLVWAAAEAVAFRRTKIPIVIVDGD